MDPQEALDILESARPGDVDALDPLIAEARRVVAGDFVSTQVVQRRGQLDRQIARQMRDIPVPQQAKSRLLALLQSSAPATDRPVSDVVPAEPSRPSRAFPGDLLSGGASPRHSESSPNHSVDAVPIPADRRGFRWVRRSVVLAAVLLCAVALGFSIRTFVGGGAGEISVEEVRSVLAADSSDRSFYSGAESPRLPSGSGWNSGRIVFETPPRGIPLSGRREVPASPFAMSVRGRPPVQGWLVAIPAASVKEPPAATSFRHANVVYLNGHASVAWTDGDLVFVCVVRGGDDALRLIEWALDVRIS